MARLEIWANFWGYRLQSQLPGGKIVRMNSNDKSRRIRFGPYEADFHTQELRKHGVRLRLSGQPLQVLELLAARPGELVTRTELQQQLWPGQVFVDSTHGLNAAINKLRDALSDSASEPRFIETLPRRGYRFIGTLESDPPQTVPSATEPVTTRTDVAYDLAEPNVGTPVVDISSRRARSWMILSIAAALLFVVGLTFIGRKEINPSQNLESQKRKAEAEKLVRAELDSTSNSSFLEKILRGRSSAAVGRVADAANDQSPVMLGGAATLRHALSIHRVIWGDGGNAAPQFSPDGRRIAFMSDRNGPWQIWVSDVDGSRARQVSFTDSAGTPRWSPDGTSIAFDAPYDGSTWIFVIRVDHSERAEPIVEGRVPSFSRDGNWIYFASDRTGDWQVWKTSTRSRSEAQMSFNGGFAALESTDGYVYYSKSRYPQPEICRVRIGGGNESCSFQHLRPRTWASWAPTRQGIVFAEDLPNGKSELSLYDPARRQTRDLALLQSAPFWVGASVDGKRAIMNDAAERQISLVENLP